MMRPDLPVFTDDLYLPVYRPLQSGTWGVHQGQSLLCQGYWSPPTLVETFAALLRGGGTWMSTTPMELGSRDIGVRLARGHVVVGLGIGWSAVASALRPEVIAVTVVERGPEVIPLHRELDLAAQPPPDVRAMQANVRAAAVHFRGQELDIPRHAVAPGRALGKSGIEATIAALDLPLIGPGLPGYAETLPKPAERHMPGRRLPGSTPPSRTVPSRGRRGPVIARRPRRLSHKN